MTTEDSAQPKDDPTIQEALESGSVPRIGDDVPSDVDEIDLSIVAERGLGAIPESRRDAVAAFMAASPAAAQAVIEARRASTVAPVEQDEVPPAPLLIGHARTPPGVRGSTWWMAAPSSVAALIAVASSIGWLTSQPTIEEQLGGFDRFPGDSEIPVLPDIDDTPVLADPVVERQSQTDPGDGWRRVTITAGVAAVVFSPLLCIAISRRSRRKAGSPA